MSNEKVEIEAPVADNKQKYKDLMKYRTSKNCVKMIEDSKFIADGLYKAMYEELKKRKKPELISSELDRTFNYAKFLDHLIENIDSSEGGKIVKEELLAMKEKAMSNVEIKVALGFDAPMFTKLDMIKAERAEFACVDQTIDHIVSKYAEVKKEEAALHPYDEN